MSHSQTSGLVKSSIRRDSHCVSVAILRAWNLKSDLRLAWARAILKSFTGVGTVTVTVGLDASSELVVPLLDLFSMPSGVCFVLALEGVASGAQAFRQDLRLVTGAMHHDLLWLLLCLYCCSWGDILIGRISSSLQPDVCDLNTPSQARFL